MIRRRRHRPRKRAIHMLDRTVIAYWMPAFAGMTLLSWLCDGS